MGIIALDLPVIGNSNATEDPKIRAGFVTLQTVINGGLDSTNIADSAITTPKIVDSAVTSRKIAPTISVAQNPAMNQVGGAEADVAGSVLTITPLVVSTVVVEATVHLSIGASASGIIRVRQDAVNDAMDHEMFPSAAGNFTMPVFAVFTGVTVAAHTYRLRFFGSGGAGCNLIRFRIMATVYAQ